jgi:IS30 family transposase
LLWRERNVVVMRERIAYGLKQSCTELGGAPLLTFPCLLAARLSKAQSWAPLRRSVSSKRFSNKLLFAWGLTSKFSLQGVIHFLSDSQYGSAETIYRALFCGLLGSRTGKLRTGRSCRKAQRRGVAPPNKIKDKRLLGQRPAQVSERQQAGNWEGDLIIGAKMASAIGTLVERVTRFVVPIHLPDGYKAPQLRDALIAQTAHLPAAIRRTLTWDQGREMALHAQTSAATGFEIFFCDPHSPWQRGTNENTNGLLRQYFPKHTDLAPYSEQSRLKLPPLMAKPWMSPTRFA